jgi:hypothetical protein
LDVAREVACNADFLVTPETLLAWEREHGRIPAGAWVLLRTGWSERKSAADYINLKDDGPTAPAGRTRLLNSSLANATSSAWESKRSVPMLDKRRNLIRHFQITTSCTAAENLVWRDCATWISFLQREPL